MSIRDRIRAAHAALSKLSADDLAWLGVAPAVVITYAASEWLAVRIAGRLLQPLDYGFFPEWRPLILPEPTEEARFLIVIAIPLVLAAAVLLFGSSRPARPRFDLPVIAIQAGGLAFLVVAVSRQVNDGWLLPDYFDDLLLSVPNILAGIAIGLALTVALIVGRVPAWPRARAVAAWLQGRPWIALVAVVAVTTLWLLPAIVTDGTIGTTGLARSHLPFQFGDYTAVVNGRTPMVDFVPQYTFLLPLPVAPLLSAFDSSITSFTIIMSALSLLAFMAVYWAFVQITEGRHWMGLGLYVPFLALSLFPWAEYGLERDYNGNYYAQLPGRYIGPFVIVWLCARRARRSSPPLWVIFFLAGLTLLNNFEFGVCCLAATIAAAALWGDRAEPVWDRLRAEVPQAAAGLLGSLALVSAVMLIRTGELPDLSLLPYWSKFLGGAAFGLLPMPSWGLHWAMYLTYVGALLLAVVRFVRSAPNPAMTAMLAFGGIFGLSTGQYFAGRSDPTLLMSLFPVWALALAPLAWSVGLSLREARLDRTRLRRLIIPAVAVMAGFGVMVSGLNRFPLPWNEVDRLSNSGEAVYDQPFEQQFIKDQTEPGEPILLMATRVDHRVAERAGVENVSPWGSYSLFSPKEVTRALDNLEEEGGTKLFHPTADSSALTPVELMFYERGYRIVGSDPLTHLDEWVLQ